MKHLTINANDITPAILRRFAFGWCNAINTGDTAAMRAESNLEVVFPDSDPTAENHYFFDLRDCLDENYRPQGVTPASKALFIARELGALTQRLVTLADYDLLNIADQGKAAELDRRLTAVSDRLDALADEVLAVADKLQEV